MDMYHHLHYMGWDFPLHSIRVILKFSECIRDPCCHLYISSYLLMIHLQLFLLEWDWSSMVQVFQVENQYQRYLYLLDLYQQNRQYHHNISNKKFLFQPCLVLVLGIQMRTHHHYQQYLLSRDQREWRTYQEQSLLLQYQGGLSLILEFHLHQRFDIAYY